MLELDNIHVQIGSRTILRGVSLRVTPGEVLAVAGPNGAGKTTLIRTASGALIPVAGQVRVNGVALSQLSSMQRARRVAVVPQARSLPGAFSVYQSVLFGRTPYMNWLGQAGPADHAQVLLALERTGLADLAQRPVGELSGGEAQRVLLARALAQQAPILLLDEPTTHLDLRYQSSLLNLVRELARGAGLAVLMVLHDLNLSSLYADRMALLVEGQVQASGAPSQVLTADRLSAVYGVPVNVTTHPEYGVPLVLPDGKNIV